MMQSPQTRTHRLSCRDGNTIQLGRFLVVTQGETREIASADAKNRIGDVGNRTGVEHHVKVRITAAMVDYKSDVRICRRPQAIT